MPPRKRKPPRTVPFEDLVTDEYLELLRKLAATIPPPVLRRRSGLARQTLWRVLSDEGKNRTLWSVLALRTALQSQTLTEIPPPLVTVSSTEEYTWHRAGTILRERDPERYKRMVDQLRRYIDGEYAKVKLGAIALDAATETLTTDDDVDDDASADGR